MKKILARAAASKMAWAAATLLILYTLGGFLLAPYLLERNLPRYAEQYLGQPASIGGIRINPYLFILDMSDFQLGGTSEPAMLTFKRLYVDFELSSIFRGAWTFAEFRTEGLALRLEADREGRLNIMELVKRLQGPQEPERKEESPPSVIVEHMMVSDSSISFSDLSDATPASTTLAPINLELTGFSTIPDREGRYVLAATLPAGASLAWKGSLTLHPLASSGEFSIKGMKLATAWQFLRDELRIAEPHGEFTLAGHYVFSRAQSKTMLDVTGIQAELSGLLVAPPAGSPALLALRNLRISDARFALDERKLVVPGLRLLDGKLSASLANDGTLDWQHLVEATAAASPPGDGAGAAGSPAAPDAVDAKQPWRVQMENVDIENIALAYTDHTRSPPAAFRAGAISSKFNLDMTAGAGPATAVVGDFQLAVNNITVAAIAAGATATGATGENAENTVAAADTGGTAGIAGMADAALDSLTLTGGRLDTRARTALVEKVTASDGDIVITRGPDGPTGLLQLLLPASSKSGENPPPPDAIPAVPAGAPWKYRAGSLELKQFGVRLADHGFTPPIAYDIDVVSAVLENIDRESGSPILFATELRVGGQGVVKGEGTLQQDFGQARGKLDATGIALEPLRPLVARHTTLDLKSGHAEISAALSYRSDATPPAMTAEGNASIHDFRLNEAGTEERLIAWKTLSARKIALSLEPNRLAIKEVRIVEPGMKLVIGQDRSVNLNRIMKNDPSGKATANQQAPAKKPPPEKKRPEGKRKTARGGDDSSFPARINQVRIVGGSLDFADLSLILPFSTHVHALDGSVAGISSARRSRTKLDLTGQVETYGEARAAGMLLPSDPKKFLDIEVNFDNIEMPPLSPYSATFAGRKIAAGKLWLTLHYKIVDGKLAGENRIMLADFKLGERVEAPNALDLPLDLAIALLKEPDGKIELAVPVEGDVGNPTFDYGTVIRGALANVILRVVSSPFRLLGGLLDDNDAEKLRKVEFEPGSDDIEPAQREQLDILVKALKKRPKIGVVVKGPYDAKRDGQHLRNELAHRDLAIAMGAAPEPGEDLGLIVYRDADTQKALEKLLAERGGPDDPGGDAVQRFADEYAKKTGRQPDRVNKLLGLFGRGSRDRAFYEALFERLVEIQPLPDNALQALAARRTQAIMDVLLKAGIDSKRLVSGSVEPVTGEPGKPIPAELSLDVAAGDS